MTYYDKYRYLTTLDAVDDYDNWWVAGYEINGIFKVSKKDNTVELIKKTETADKMIKRYRYSFEYRGKMYFLPSHSYNIEVYDTELKMFYCIGIPGENRKEYATIGYITDDKYIYMFSTFCEETPIRLNTLTMECERIGDSWKDIIKEYAKDKLVFICSIAEQKGYIWCGVYGTNTIICSKKSDLNDIKVIHLEEQFNIYRVANAGKNRLILSSLVDNECIVYNTIDNMIEYKIDVKEIGLEVNILSDGEEIVLIPQYGRKLMLINTDTRETKIIDCTSEKMKCFDENDRFFYYGKMDEQKIYLYPYNTNVLTIINRKDMSISYEEWEMEKDTSTKDIMAKYVIEDKDGVYYEKRCDIDNFLENIIKNS